MLTAIREIYRARASPIIPSLMRSFHHVIDLTCREMDSVDCAALLFTLKHSDRVQLNLLWTSVPTEEIESILSTLDKLSHLRSDISACFSSLSKPLYVEVTLAVSLEMSGIILHCTGNLYVHKSDQYRWTE